MMERRQIKTPAQRRWEVEPWFASQANYPSKAKLHPIAAEYLEARIAELRGSLYWMIEHCESPIEQLLAVELYVEKWLSEGLIQYVMPQYEVETEDGKFRIDFAIKAGGVPWAPKFVRIAVECDGHEFHEKTKEQAQRDKARDRALQRAGWVVLRYTGSEIFNRPWDVMADIRRTIDELTGFNAHIQEQLARSFPEWFGDGNTSAP